LWLYGGEANSPFDVIGQQGAFVRVMSQGGTLNFWTLAGNVVNNPAASPQYDDTVAGQPVEFVSANVFACEAQYPRPLVLGLCAELPEVSAGEVVQRAQVDGSVLYLVRINNRLYWVSSNVLRAEPQ
jgi:hypothetical protein